MTQQRVSPISVTSVLPATVTLSVQGALGQSARLQQWLDSTGTVLARVDNLGGIQSGTMYAGAYSYYNASLNVTAPSITQLGLVVRGVASQTANLFQAQNSAGTVIGGVAANGAAFFGTSGAFNASLSIAPTAASASGIIVRGVASQSANIIQWQDSSAVVLGGVDSNGFIYAGRVLTTNAYAALREINGGGFVQLFRQTAAGPNLGANFGAIYLRDGTNAGTLKLVVRAGAAGAETTILDNIPQ